MPITIVKSVAGSGKTKYVIDKALEINTKILIVTFTNANKEQLTSRLIKQNSFLPKNIDIMTWLEFLYKHLAKPYSNLFEKDLSFEGVELKVEPKNEKGVNKTNSKWYKYEKNNKIYKNRLSEFCSIMFEKSNFPVERLSKIYTHLFVDEAQDLCGYDYEIVKKLIESQIEIILVGDPLQNTYNTHNTTKNNQYKDIFEFLESKNIHHKKEHLASSYRCTKNVCDYINTLWTSLIIQSAKHSCESSITLVTDDNIEQFIAENNNITALIYDKTHKNEVDNRITRIYNIGESKGLEFENVIIYGTKNMVIACKNKNVNNLQSKTKNLLYVALTRSKNNVGVYIGNENESESLFD